MGWDSDIFIWYPKYFYCSVHLFILNQSLATINLFTVSIVLPFPEHYTVETMQYISFSNFFHLVICIYGFLYGLSWFDSLFLIIPE